MVVKKAVENGLVGQVLARPLFLKVKTKFCFTKSKDLFSLLYYDTADRKKHMMR